MFYEQSDITEVLSCEHCLQAYDAYFSPKILPCCTKTVCNTCIQLIEKQVKENKYKCICCNEVEMMPKKGLQIDLTAARLIEKQPKEIPRGPEADKLKQNLISSSCHHFGSNDFGLY